MRVPPLLLLSLSTLAAGRRGGSYEYKSDCVFSWMERAGACSATCGEGTRAVYREPRVATQAHGSGRACPAPRVVRTEPCNLGACPGDLELLHHF